VFVHLFDLVDISISDCQDMNVTLLYMTLFVSIINYFKFICRKSNGNYVISSNKFPVVFDKDILYFRVLDPENSF
jgi:hypothetical protein